mgnify:CR=1 FL=1
MPIVPTQTGHDPFVEPLAPAFITGRRSDSQQHAIGGNRVQTAAEHHRCQLQKVFVMALADTGAPLLFEGNGAHRLRDRSRLLEILSRAATGQ